MRVAARCRDHALIVDARSDQIDVAAGIGIDVPLVDYGSGGRASGKTHASGQKTSTRESGSVATRLARRPGRHLAGDPGLKKKGRSADIPIL